MTRDVRAARLVQLSIDGEICSVYTAKNGKSTWLAYGDFNNVSIRRTGRTESEAMESWRSIAESKAKE